MSRTLVIGIGNTIRGDDGVGVLIAGRIADRHPEVDVLCLHQLSPELADTITRYDRLVIVDASIAAPGLRVTPLRADMSMALPRTHDVTPGGILALASTLYHRTPDEAILVEIPAASCDFSETLSPVTAGLVEECLGLVETYLTGS